MKLSKALAYCFVLIGLHACGQTKPTKAMIQELLSVKRYEQRPEYRLAISGMNCNWDIEVNDMPYDSYLGNEGGITGDLPLNPRILSSGIQKIKLKVFPLKGEKLMSIYSTLRLVLSYYSDNKNYNGTMQELNNYSLPADSVNNKPYYEYEYSFDAKVPYTQIGWTMSKDLSKIPNIREKVISKLNEFTKLIEGRDNKGLLMQEMEKRKNRYECFYATDSSIRQDIAEADYNIDFAQIHDSHYISNDTGELVFYANNRVVCMRHNGLASYDYGIQINSLDKNNKPTQLSYQFLFHIPEGTNELKIIR